MPRWINGFTALGVGLLMNMTLIRIFVNDISQIGLATLFIVGTLLIALGCLSGQIQQIRETHEGILNVLLKLTQIEEDAILEWKEVQRESSRGALTDN